MINLLNTGFREVCMCICLLLSLFDNIYFYFAYWMQFLKKKTKTNKQTTTATKRKQEHKKTLGRETFKEKLGSHGNELVRRQFAFYNEL